MKIVIIVSLFPPKWLAGTEIATYNIAKHLVKRGHDVHVITSLDEGFPRESMEEGFYVHRIPCGKMRIIGIVSFWLRIFLCVRKIDPEIVHTQSIGTGIPGFLANVFMKKPNVVYARGSDAYLPWSFKKPISKIVFKHANAIIALTEDMKKKMNEVTKKEIFVIPNGIDLNKFSDFSKETIRKDLKMDREIKIITFVGTLRHVKGVRYLIEAMKVINQCSPNTRLMLVGEGDDRDKMEKLVKKLDLNEYITFVGCVSNEDIPKYMAASDLLVLPSLSEGFPVVILEAMASGLPIVATNVGGLPEIVKDGINGFLVEPRDPKEIADNILLLLKDSKLSGIISKNNKEKSNEYSWDTTVDKLEVIYQGLLVDF